MRRAHWVTDRLLADDDGALMERGREQERSC
jgi:hypothetical protein